MSLDSRPAVVAELSDTAKAPGAIETPPLPATPTTPTEATGRGGNHKHYSICPITHRGFDLWVLEEDDGEGWSTPAYCAHRTGERAVQLNHPRFGFEPSQEWFAAEVDELIARREAGLTRAYSDGFGVLLCLTLFCALAWCGSAMA